MSYMTQGSISNNGPMNIRIAQCAASEPTPPEPDVDQWTYDHRRVWAAAPGWDDAWEYALNTHREDPDYDPGADEAVITDEMILAQVQRMLAADAEPTP